jgi:hypothetical protein
MGRPQVVIPWGGRLQPRRDVILELHAQGVPKADIAQRLGVIYQIVQQVVGPTSARATPSPGRTQSAKDRGRSLSFVETAPADVDVSVILLGCVKTKATRALPAKDLYVSPLFRGRRAHAEASGKPWFIVSAEYGLVAPDEIIEPYDTLIGQRPLAERHALARQVADRLEAALGGLRGKGLELHAGEEYAQAIGPTLVQRGAQIVRPLRGMDQGSQLRWYRTRYGSLGSPNQRPRTGIGRQSVSSTIVGDGRGLGIQLTQLFVNGDLDLSARSGAPAAGWAGMPEVVACNALRSRGADPATVRCFLTFCAAMDRARDADRLANRAIALQGAHPWAFEPSEVARRPIHELSAALRAYGVSQRHHEDLFAWRVIAESLAEERAPVARAAIYDGRADAIDLFAELQGVHADGTPLFPLLRGPKIGALWIRLLAHPGGAAISSLALVPVAVDVQVRKVTEYLGVTDTAGRDLDDVREVIQRTWTRDVELHGSAGPDGLANTAGALDPALWFYGKWGCTVCERAGERIPISVICADCRFGTDESTTNAVPETASHRNKETKR